MNKKYINTCDKRITVIVIHTCNQLRPNTWAFSFEMVLDAFLRAPVHAQIQFEHHYPLHVALCTHEVQSKYVVKNQNYIVVRRPNTVRVPNSLEPHRLEVPSAVYFDRCKMKMLSHLVRCYRKILRIRWLMRRQCATCHRRNSLTRTSFNKYIIKGDS